jgi:ComF family protein
MQRILSFILDFVFPPTKEEIFLRNKTSRELFVCLPKNSNQPFPFIHSVFTYRDPLVTELIKGIKQRNDRHSFEIGGYALYTIARALWPNTRLVFIPIPLSKKRRKERGYNQCELLVKFLLENAQKIKDVRSTATEMVAESEARYDILKRVAHSSEQKLKNRSERFESKNIFTALPQSVTQITDTIIIIDDVTTTGSTLKEARDVLENAGYKDIYALTLAH